MSEPSLPAPDGYADLLEDLKRTVAESRWQAQRVVNTELVRMSRHTGYDATLTRAGSASATFATCAHSRRPGPQRFGNNLLPNFPGATSQCSWTRSKTPPNVTGTQLPLSNTAGHVTSCSVRS